MIMQLDHKYQMLQKVGQGKEGCVYLAVDMRMQKNVAVKKLGSIPAIVFEKELEIHKNLYHSGLPALLDAFCENGEYFLVMEWIEGETLEQYLLRNGGMGTDLIYRYLKQLLEVLSYLHQQPNPIVYQDLKPSNIMLTRNGKLKLIDFGAAFMNSYQGDIVFPMGTRGYAAPEQMDGGIIGCYSDIYALGRTLYSMSSGILLNRPPFRMNDIEFSCPNLDKKLKYIIARATSEDVSNRIQSLSEIELILQQPGYKIHLPRHGLKKQVYTQECVFLSEKKLPGLWSI